ncbi:MAG: site-specific integrase [Colwellia sp.]
MKKRFKFTTASLKSLPSNPTDSSSTELEFSDTDIVGLKCLSGKTDSKRFLLRYKLNGRKSSIAIGRFPDVDLVSARQVARKYKAMIANGTDPKIERDTQVSIPSVGDFFWSTYLPLAKKRKTSWNDDVARFTLHCRDIANLKYSDLTANHVMRIQLEMSESSHKYRPYAPATCNRVTALLKTMGKLADKLLDIPNTAERVSLLPENNARTRYCDVNETRRIIKAAREYPCPSIGSFIALLFIIGCRASELRFRVWRELDLDKRTLTIPRTKNGSYHIIYLSDLMVDILSAIPRVPGNPYIFSGNKHGQPISPPRWAFDLIKDKAEVENPGEVLFHTARHSVASNLISHGVDISSVQKLLNHRSIESTLRYAKLSEGKQRDTSDKLSALLETKPVIK